METVSSLLPFALILVAFYLLIIRPARTRQRAAQAVIEQARPGTEVMTTSGMFGRIVATADDSVDIEVAPGTTIRFAKAAVGRIVSPVADDDAVADPSVEDETAPGRSEHPDRTDAERPGQDNPAR